MSCEYIFKEFAIPEYMTGGLEGYLNHGLEPGSFLMAVLCNDFVGVCAHADDTNLRNLPAYAAYLYNFAPTNSWGSEGKVNEWMRAKRSGVEN